MSVVGTRSIAGVVWLNVTGSAGDGCASGPGARCGSDVVVDDVLVEVDVDEERTVGTFAEIRAPSTWIRDREPPDSFAFGIALAMPTEPTIRATATIRVIQRREGIRGARCAGVSVRTGQHRVTVERPAWHARPMAAPVPDMRDWGLTSAGELDRVVVVSPHLDDAVLGCGRFMAAHPGTIVVTVYAGGPPRYPDPMTHWDTIAGFDAGDDVLAARRREDELALGELRAIPHWLDFVEHQYLDRPDWVGPEATRERLARELRALEPSAIFIPFGIANPDHGATHEAAMLVREEYPEPSWFCYEDFGYKHIPGLLAWRVSQLFRTGVWPTPVAIGGDASDEAKHRALSHYVSQLRALEADWQLGPKLVAPEQIWRLAPPPSGWESLAATT